MQPSNQPVSAEEIYSVTRLVKEARWLLEGSFPELWIEGEISNLARPSSGHLYFSLKDAQTQVRCAMFRSRNSLLAFEPENGMQVLLRAKPSLYEGRGEFQLIVERMEPSGEGALRLAFEQLKAKLDAEGLFAAERKRPIPGFAECVGIITSPSGAAIRDILNVLARRFPALPVVIYPVAVQGGEAAPQIIRALQTAGQRRECDVLILTRGGGSLEDLWAFNLEGVARAIAACPIPVVSAIGHEIDFTIADFASDLRAPTPSAAAELVSPDRAELAAKLQVKERRLLAGITGELRRCRERLRTLGARLKSPQRRYQELSQRIDDTAMRLAAAARGQLQRRRLQIAEFERRLAGQNPEHTIRQQLGACRHLGARLVLALDRQLKTRRSRIAELGRALDAISPLATLNRGYAIATDDASGNIVKSAEDVAIADTLTLRLAHGRLKCLVKAKLK